MDTSITTLLGLVFLGLAMASVFLMFKLWGYPYDEATHTSTAPRSLVLLHRAMGFSYVILYVFMMWHMVPRMWNYQIELPPRTVAHLMLGISIGVLLLLKISILRFFRHFSSALPYLGSTLLLCTVLLIGLSVPFTLREQFLGMGRNLFSDASLKRVHSLLKTAGVPGEVLLDQLASPRKLRDGRQVLLSKCVLCHDLRTVLAKPRTPKDWVHTVQRMAIKPILGEPITEMDQWTVSAYLVAITPDLQASAKVQRKRQVESSKVKTALLAALGPASAEAAPPDKGYDATVAKALFEDTCSQCHDISEVDNAPPRTEIEIQELMVRMVDNGLFLEGQDLETIKRYLNETYVRKQ
ncbi:MAG: hypothetical protein O7G87_06455 [bacterium]|nr:hypothetical protein [bacterium]